MLPRSKHFMEVSSVTMRRNRHFIAVLLCILCLAAALPAHAAGAQRVIGIARPALSAQFVPIKDWTPVSARMWLDDQEIAPQVDAAWNITYTPASPLKAGTHKARVEWTLKNGNRTWPYTRDWSFIIADGALSDLPEPVPEARTAIARVNQYRTILGLPPVTENQAIDAAANSHARYLIDHGGAAHRQTPGEKGYTGTDPSDRAGYFGYPAGVGEVIAYGGNPIRAVDLWMATLYHRFGVIHPQLTDAGYGQTAGGGDVLNAARNWDRAGEVAYPYPGQTDVPTQWSGRESPDPGRLYPAAPKGPWGYTVTLTFAKYPYPKALTLTEGVLTDSTGAAVEVMRFDPANDEHLDDSVALIPYKPLKPDTRYMVRLAGQIDYGSGPARYERTWSFRTESAEAQGRLWRKEGTFVGGNGYYAVDGTNFPPDIRVFSRGVPVENLTVNSNRLTFNLPAFQGNRTDRFYFVSGDGHELFSAGGVADYEGEPPTQAETVSLLRKGQVVSLQARVYADTHVLIPLTELVRLGVSVEHELNTSTQAIRTTAWRMDGHTARTQVGSAVALADGRQIVLPMPVQELGGTIHVPQPFAEALLGGRIGRGDTVPPVPLTDLAGHWAANEVTTLVEAGVVNGNGDGLFRPGDSLTRAAFVKMLTVALNLPTLPGGPSGLTDTASHWVSQQGYLGAAVSAGLVKPGEYLDGRFEPDRPVTREEIAVMVVRAMGLAGEAEQRQVQIQSGRLTVGSQVFTDAAAWTRIPYVVTAVERGIVTGYKGADGAYQFRPGGMATRAEAAVIIVRLMHQTGSLE